jgi:prepilin-type processing-associated H-X9-DG protein
MIVSRRCHSGLTLVETVISILLIALLLSLLLPALITARSLSYRDRCQDNQRQIGQAWEMYLQDNDQQFPTLPLQPGWLYGGVRFSQVDGIAFPDLARPLSPYLPCPRTHDRHEIVWCCPADRGITDPHGGGTGGRTAFHTFGTSFRANAPMLSMQIDQGDGQAGELRGLSRSEIATPASRMLLQGDAVWHEVAEQTGRSADWHGEPGAGNLLFLDGSVRFLKVRPRGEPGAVVYQPMLKTPAEPDEASD